MGWSWEVVGAVAGGYEDAVDFGLEEGVGVGLAVGGEVVVGEVDAGEGVGEAGYEVGGGVEVEGAGFEGAFDEAEGAAKLSLFAG